ncbi:MAG: hypothetical protein H0T89_18400 [Deltaproteobacteria bacterium]|nr:hypothetical protein [Deltaproteobacteria bacterium]
MARLALVLSLSVGFVALEGHHEAAYADDDDEDDDGGGDDDDGGDGGEDGEDGEDVEDPKDQPSVTAGGLYTLKTFPIRENERPLTITQNITQLRLGLGTDVSNKGAFESAGVSLEGLHGLKDNFMLVGGLTSAYNFKQFALYGGFEGALMYDVIDFRLAARIGRAAANVSTDPMMVDYKAGDIKMALDIGFPFRYVARPEVAIIALNTLMSIDFNATDCFDDGMGGEKCFNEVKPDLNPSLGIVTNPIAAVSLFIFAQLQVVDFDFTNNLRVPATARIQFSPNRKFDIGGEFTLLNVKPKEGEGGAFDNRFLTLFIATRVGK